MNFTSPDVGVWWPDGDLALRLWQGGPTARYISSNFIDPFAAQDSAAVAASYTEPGKYHSWLQVCPANECSRLCFQSGACGDSCCGKHTFCDASAPVEAARGNRVLAEQQDRPGDPHSMTMEQWRAFASLRAYPLQQRRALFMALHEGRVPLESPQMAAAVRLALYHVGQLQLQQDGGCEGDVRRFWEDDGRETEALCEEMQRQAALMEPAPKLLLQGPLICEIASFLAQTSQQGTEVARRFMAVAGNWARQIQEEISDLHTAPPQDVKDVSLLHSRLQTKPPWTCTMLRRSCFGPNMGRDKLMQAAMRLRQLDKRQTLIIAAPGDICTSISEVCGLTATHDIQPRHVLEWVLWNTARTNERALMKDGEPVTPSATGAQWLSKLYEHGNRRGHDFLVDQTTAAEECEREVEQEEEKEQEVEVEAIVPWLRATAEQPWVSNLKEATSPLDNNTTDDRRCTMLPELPWAANVRVTDNFLSCAADPNASMAIHVRVADNMLIFKDHTVLLISEREAEHVIKAVRDMHESEVSACLVNMAACRWTAASPTTAWQSVPLALGPLPEAADELPDDLACAVVSAQVFSGETEFACEAAAAGADGNELRRQAVVASVFHEEQQASEVGVGKAADAIKKLVEQRGRQLCWPGSDLETICDDEVTRAKYACASHPLHLQI
eukprot:jgi/Ulvmu1/10031/UM059_0080.1